MYFNPATGNPDNVVPERTLFNKLEARKWAKWTSFKTVGKRRMAQPDILSRISYFFRNKKNTIYRKNRKLTKTQMKMLFLIFVVSDGIYQSNIFTYSKQSVNQYLIKCTNNYIISNNC
jgi:hypothetical protein